MSRKPSIRKYKKIIAPRLANGESRDTLGHGLPPEIKWALRKIAYDEGKSMSWVLEQIIIEYFGLEQPEYVPSKAQIAEEQKHGPSRIPSKSSHLRVVAGGSHQRTRATANEARRKVSGR